MTASVKVNAHPTKDLFIFMLVRDIELLPAIVDLIDNSIDGARRVSKGENLSKQWVHAKATKNSFTIEDNCGGISVKVAKEYAFRFGRPEEAGYDNYSIGQFGVGMKRALFKLGKAFRIDSRTPTEAWTMEVDVEKWRREAEWEFELVRQSLKESELKEPGTRLHVSRLHDSVAADFALTNRFTALAAEIESVHRESLVQGLRIELNDVALTGVARELDTSPKLKPHVEVLKLPGNRGTATIIAGVRIGQHARDAGWYVFCNGRLVVGAEQGERSGWGEGDLTARFHPEFRFFRGYVLFESKDAEHLPWTTTKTDIDENSPAWIPVRQRMVASMKPILKWLSALTAETSKGASITDKPADVEAAARKRVGAVTPVKVQVDMKKSTFRAPPIKPTKKAKSDVEVKYWRPRARVERAKAELGVTTASDVGAATFDYFYDNEIGKP